MTVEVDLLLQLVCNKAVTKFHLVRTARLELAHLSALPPQDSVSTNFTTSAVFLYQDGMRKPYGYLLS